MEYVWLCLAAAAAGAVNAVAGGGTLLTFPALRFTPLLTSRWDGSILANATSTVALLPGSVASAWGYRTELRRCRTWLVALSLPSLLGGGLGAELLVHGGPRIFEPLVPWLILTAACLFLLQPALARYFRRHAGRTPPGPVLLGAIILGQFAIGVYGGYFGAGIGILMLSSLAFLGLDDIHHVNALKTFLAFCTNGISAVLFVVRAQVYWPYAVAMAAAAILGGYVGARWARTLRPDAVRGMVIAIGFGLAAYYFSRQWAS
ncbi:MAG: sulfite exporter TauE/SafE family protein [Gemmataceae bacterium]|nr:sulfite exporter TauE/SafE family protein [Gemmataceae bacterium]